MLTNPPNAEKGPNMGWAKVLLFIFICSILFLVTGCFRQQKQDSYAATPRSANTSPPVQVSSDNIDAAEPAIASAGDAGAYVVWVEHNEQRADLMFARLNASGQTQGSPIHVNPDLGKATAWRGDPPTIAVAPDGTIYVGWTTRVESPTGNATDLVLSASHDGGKTFSPPVKVNDDQKPAVHGMHSLAVGSDGHVYLAWLDERNIPKPEHSVKAEGHHMESNREVFVTSSSDGGRTFAPNRRAAVDVCPCCKTALAVGKDRRVYLSWRQVLPGDFRHIAVASSTDDAQTFSPSVIVSDDRWVLNGCPVSGATLSVGANGVLNVLWYAAGQKGQPGLYTSQSTDGGQTFSPRTPVAASSARGTPVLLSDGNVFAAVWESDDNGSPNLMTTRLNAARARMSDVTISSNGELPAAAINGDRLFVAFVSNANGRQNVVVTSAVANDLYGTDQ